MYRRLYRGCAERLLCRRSLADGKVFTVATYLAEKRRTRILGVSRRSWQESSRSTPIARTGRSPPFPSAFPSIAPSQSIRLSRSPILDRAWHTHLDDQLDLGYVPVTGAVLMAVVRHPEGYRSRRRKKALLSLWRSSAALAVAGGDDGGGDGNSLPPVTRERTRRTKRTKRDGGSRNTDATRIAPRSRR